MSPTIDEIRAQYAPSSNTAPAPLIVSPPPRSRVTIDQVVRAVTEEVSIRPIANSVGAQVAPEVTRTTMYVDRQTIGPNDNHDVTVGESAQRTAEARNWSWEQLRDYVVAEIEKRFGIFPRDLLKERGIFSSFRTRHGELAGPIAVYAFEVHGGMWKGAPISVTRFCKGSDPYFAAPITSTVRNLLAHAPAQ